MKATVRGEGNCGTVTDRGKEACEDVRKRRVCIIATRTLHTKPARLRTETLYEADALGELAADNEASPEDEAEVDGEFGQGKITFLFGEICCAYLGVSHLDD